MTIKLGVRRDDLIAAVKAEAARRLAATDWMVIRAAEGGAPLPAAVAAERAAIRARSNDLERQPPADYADDKYWPTPA